MSSVIIFTDGASKGNPGPASIGASLVVDEKEVAWISESIGQATNNIAEYTALLEGLRKAQELGYQEVLVKADSELMVKQLNGEYRVKNPDIKVIFLKVQELIKEFDKISFTHVRREFNQRADQLANLAL
ncbi:MAG: ribonuclease HI family protein [Candidatus Melainabacteria bacterium]|nr:ribonuclease HI family protein [Candidatus Melainabacteria bacterium]